MTEHFGHLEDCRRDQGKRHQLLDIIAMTICAVIGGAEGWDDVELFVQCKYDWFQRFLDLPHGVPCSDTFARVFAGIDPEQFRSCFMDWVNSVSQLTQGEVIALDGKTLRRSHDRPSGKEAIHMVSAWASENSLVLGQVKVDEKSNEITAIPELLNLLDVSGCIVTIDAMGCQKKIAGQIVGQEADYLLAVKENQGKLLEDVVDLFSCGRRTGFADMQHDFCQSVDGGHGRVETRCCWTIDDPEQLSYLDTRAWIPEAIGLDCGASVWSRRNGGKGTRCRWKPAITFPVCSRMPSGSCKRLEAIGASKTGYTGCWTCPSGKTKAGYELGTGNAPENLAVVRHMALNLLRQDRTCKASIKAKRKLAGWDNNYLLSILSN